MNKPSNTSHSAPPHKGFSLLAAVLVGMVLGLALAGGVAWYILKRPNPFVNYAPHETVKLVPDVVKPAPVAKVIITEQPASAPVAASGIASGVGENKPRFEFYKVLTDKPEGTISTKSTSKATDKAPTKEKDSYFLQAAAFNDVDEADNLKAKLALIGLEASVHAAIHNDKEVFRVRLGPFKNAAEMNKISAILKQNGVSAISVHVQ